MQAGLFAEANALPSGLVYQAGFLDAEDEARVLEGVRALDLREAQYKEYTARRRVASFGAGYDFDANELTPAPEMAPFLLPLRDRAARWAGLEPSDLGYALVAEYRPGTQLGWHRDVPQFEKVVGISLAGTARMRFRRFPPRAREPIFNLDLAPRSAYILQDEARWGWQHSIAPTAELRYSITFRTRKA
ncbi:MAG TPA: alpha-ketoglutarate-dependent dioxygenase AlkB [Usitatibacter sp.]|nr:alpha-ketoglutarate-dependent dioxygenase AlkB [Usitatibacter sp.]